MIIYNSILDNFPKKKGVLSAEYQEIYDGYFLQNRHGKTKITSLAKRMEQWLHKQVASDLKNCSSNIKTLEIGAGTLNHLAFEPSIVDYDIVEPSISLYQKSNFINRIKNAYSDIKYIDQTNKYKRILSIASFEHIANLPEVIATAALLLENDGALRVAIPNEGSILWKLGTYVTGFEFKKQYKLDYQVFIKNEHINSAKEIDFILNYFFDKTQTKVFGINKKFAFYRFICCEKPNIERAKTYLNNKTVV